MVIDNTRHLNRILDIDTEHLTARVQPGLVLDELNRALKPQGLWFPVDPSTAPPCTLWGMAANNSSGGKSLRYGIMRNKVRSVVAMLPDGTNARFPNVLRRVVGYNIDFLTRRDVTLSQLLVGSEGTLAHLPGEKVIGACHFPTFFSAMDAAQQIVTLRPQAVELIDDTMIALGQGISLLRKTIEASFQGDPAVLLSV